ncbi:TIR domain-containing protein [Longimicrobium sp.]|uniref:TIR domain-containing protein n=1 Tax=Longimicrobium sp. TaxID=2029185 RepID=UPI003B3BA298
MQRDVFICHAREDRAATAHPLAAAMRRHGLDVSLDAEELAPGDPLRRRVDEGLARAGWGVLVIGPGFLGMEWPRAELDRLLAREMGPERLMIPVWHGVTAADVARRSPLLAARLAVDAGGGIDAACEAILTLAGRRPPAAAPPEEAQRSALPAIWRSLVENPGFSLADVHQHLAHREAYAGQEIGGYTLRELLGVGASGAVFAAVHTRLGRQVALKLFFPFADDLRQVMQATERAVRGVSSLRHPGIAALLDYDYVRIGIGAAPYLVYEPVDGRPLPEWSRGLQTRRDPSAATAQRALLARRLDVAIAAAEALRVAHECRIDGDGAAGVPHGDLKPGNVLVRADGQPVLMDFMMTGIQRLAAERLELWNGWEKDMEGSYQSGVPVSAAFGAGGYAAPEQEAAGVATPAADVYALGRLFEDLFWPDAPDGRWERGGADPQASAVTESEAAELVAAMTSPQPDARPGSAAEVVLRLQRIRAAHQARIRAGASAHA